MRLRLRREGGLKGRKVCKLLVVVVARLSHALLLRCLHCMLLLVLSYVSNTYLTVALRRLRLVSGHPGRERGQKVRLLVQAHSPSVRVVPLNGRRQRTHLRRLEHSRCRVLATVHCAPLLDARVRRSGQHDE